MLDAEFLIDFSMKSFLVGKIPREAVLRKHLTSGNVKISYWAD